jgi:hypothetical protein
MKNKKYDICTENQDVWTCGLGKISAYEMTLKEHRKIPFFELIKLIGCNNTLKSNFYLILSLTKSLLFIDSAANPLNGAYGSAEFFIKVISQFTKKDFPR